MTGNKPFYYQSMAQYAIQSRPRQPKVKYLFTLITHGRKLESGDYCHYCYYY